MPPLRRRQWFYQKNYQENLDMGELIEKFPVFFYRIGIRYVVFAGIAFLLFYVIFRNQKRIRKIQRNFPKVSDYQRDISYSVLTIVIFTIVALVTFITLSPYNLLIKDISAEPTWYWAGTFILMFFLHDFYFYWAHRWMHQPRWFKTIHKVHHLSTNPSPWTAYSFHPLEAIVEVMIIPIIAFTIPSHLLVVMIFMVFQIAYNVYGHIGYELYPKGFHKTWIGKYVNTSVSHNQHHQRFHGNYGLYTLIWDRVFGTIRPDYDEDYEKATSKPQIINTTLT